MLIVVFFLIFFFSLCYFYFFVTPVCWISCFFFLFFIVGVFDLMIWLLVVDSIRVFEKIFLFCFFVVFACSLNRDWFLKLGRKDFYALGVMWTSETSLGGIYFLGTETLGDCSWVFFLI